MATFNEYVESRNDKILVWLDDIRPMPGNFDAHVKTAQEAIELLKKGNVGEISLDHDLGMSAEDGYADPQTGYTVAKWIEEAAYHNRIPRMQMRVHTDNPEGRRNMVAALQNAFKFWRTHEEREGQ